MARRDELLTSPPPFWVPGQNDDAVAEWVNQRCWTDWLEAYRPWWRQVEQNARMLAGKQWDEFIEGVGDFVDLSSYFTMDDERWRRYPVFNWLAHYYKLTLSKLTESPPAIGYLPTSPDERDARLAALMEPVFKSGWWRMGMPEAVFDLYGWVIVAARGVTKLSWNPDLGPRQDYEGEAIIKLFGPDGIQVRELSRAPYVKLPTGELMPGIANELAMDEYGNPRFDGEDPLFLPSDAEGAEEGLEFYEPHRDRLGDLECEVVPPLSVITPHSRQPFHKKPWYTHQYVMHVDEVRRRFGVEVEPAAIPLGEAIDLKLELGTNYGMPGSGGGAGGGFGLSALSEVALRDCTLVREWWARDVPESETLERGRLIICTHTNDVLYDGENPYWVEGSRHEVTMPFEAFDLVRYPFRQEGHGDLEILTPLQRAINRRMGGAMDAVDFNEQPIMMKKRSADIEEDNDALNRPGAVVEYTDVGTRAPLERLQAGELPRGSVELAGILREWMQMLASQPFGAEGLPVTTDASGELQREVRFDVDRVWGATLRKHSYTWPRFALAMIGIYEACMSDDRIFSHAGEDQAWNFVTVGQDAWAGSVHAYPQPESMILETRQEKQNRLLSMREAFPEIPGEVFIDLLGYPDLARLSRPGGPAWAMAERENLEMILGVMPPVFPEHDHTAHLLNHRKRMQTIEYRNAPPLVQQAFRVHVQLHEMLGQQEQLRQIALAAPVAMAQGATMTAATGGPPSGGNGGGNGAPPQFAGDEQKKAPSRQDLASGRKAPAEADPRMTAREPR